LARTRPRRRLTLVTKSNAQRHAMLLWDEVFRAVAKDCADVETDRVLVDAATARMVREPRSLDVLVATNLHADILSDLAAALAGGLGLAPSANLNPERRFPSMFEPVHGSANDIAGKGIANPIGAVRSAAMMLEHLGERSAAVRLAAAVERVASDGAARTPDLGGRSTTLEVTEAIERALAADAN
jgi:tartrate dehydrogenase/decarboxylase/D-malate dehydrogenase